MHCACILALFTCACNATQVNGLQLVHFLEGCVTQKWGSQLNCGGHLICCCIGNLTASRIMNPNGYVGLGWFWFLGIKNWLSALAGRLAGRSFKYFYKSLSFQVLWQIACGSFTQGFTKAPSWPPMNHSVQGDNHLEDLHVVDIVKVLVTRLSKRAATIAAHKLAVNKNSPWCDWNICRLYAFLINCHEDIIHWFPCLFLQNYHIFVRNCAISTEYSVLFAKKTRGHKWAQKVKSAELAEILIGRRFWWSNGFISAWPA